MIDKTIFKLNKYYNRLYEKKLKNHRGFTRLQKLIERLTKSRIDGVDESEVQSIHDIEYDNLIILDACRYDLYDQVVDGDVDVRITEGSSSAEYVKANFSEGAFDDIVYVSANPWFYPSKFKEITGRDEEPGEIFHEFFNTIKTDWDEQGTVLPEKAARDTKTARKLFPDKKVVAHFMQPHHPFVRYELPDAGFGIGDVEGENVWDYFGAGQINREELWKGYEDNLRYVLEEVNELLGELEGKTVITADHGNFVGEYGLYGHPGGHDAEEVRKVPLHEVKGEIKIEHED